MACPGLGLQSEVSALISDLLFNKVPKLKHKVMETPNLGYPLELQGPCGGKPRRVECHDEHMLANCAVATEMHFSSPIQIQDATGDVSQNKQTVELPLASRKP